MKIYTIAIIIICLVIVGLFWIRQQKSSDSAAFEKFLDKFEKEQRPKSIEDALAKKEVMVGMTKVQVESMYSNGEVFDRRYWDNKIALNDSARIKRETKWAKVDKLNKGDVWYIKYHYPKYDYFVYYNKNDVVIDLVAKPVMPDDSALPPE